MRNLQARGPTFKQGLTAPSFPRAFRRSLLAVRPDRPPDSGPAVPVPVVEEVARPAGVDDGRVRLHLGVPTAGALDACLLIPTFPVHAVTRLRVTDSIRIAPGREPHAVE